MIAIGLAGCAARPHDSTQLGRPAPAVDAAAPREQGVGAIPAGQGADAAAPERGMTDPQPVPAPALVRPCRDAMVLVDGDYCTEVRQDCSRWQDPPSTPFARCATFAPSICVGKRVHKRFCIDRDEYVAPGQRLPENDVSWSDARSACEKDSKRLCFETEWELACEGEAMLPYPTGYDRDARACNIDKEDLVDPSTGRLRDERVPSSQVEACASPFGVASMTGNVDEWVWRDRTPGSGRSALKGGWWMPGRDRCRPATTVHGEHFRDVQTGFRCCADAL